ncbi:hypothetical protein GJA_3154 [Janthinobacterium agaricidamnosum NBRC 102515 = DSM 9628]|uniref:Uncharacterized protein n=1 Tax=Janthinobacterium agaricidamnosum NBRC 102515 = DSM 9628 TaxID=1349767 RepID=W0V7B7_9BURK|nr:hypothetical protein GJA_3154 [Janthinobacterium agaricidamnosum NBRC 102515 = DSM 9628]
MQESWDVFEKSMPNEIKDFNGHKDPRFLEKLKMDDENYLKESILKLKKLKESRP